jgi:Fur family ferric uptake transcriptional regulator
MIANDDLRTILKEAGYSMTAARSTVFQALAGRGPQGMRSLVIACRGIDRASVYRTVELFEKLGIVQRLQQGWKYQLELTDKFTVHHHHITCSRCGTSADLEDRELEAVIAAMATKRGFLLSGHQVEIQGICRTCQGN